MNAEMIDSIIDRQALGMEASQADEAEAKSQPKSVTNAGTAYWNSIPEVAEILSQTDQSYAELTKYVEQLDSDDGGNFLPGKCVCVCVYLYVSKYT